MHVIDWDALLEGRALPGADRVQAHIDRPEYADDDPHLACLRVVLIAPPAISRWRAVELLNRKGRQLAFAATQSGLESVEAHAPAGSRTGASRVVLWKSNAFGLHLPLYTLEHANMFRGAVITIRWVEDA